MLNKHLADLYDFYVGSEPISELSSVSSYSLIPITERREWKKVATHFKKEAISPQQRTQAKVNNQQKLAEAIEGRSQVIRTLGGTGTGKTTSFCLNAYDAFTGKFLLIVPTKAMVINAVSSLYGIKQLEAEENEIVSEESVIFPITETRKGWNQKLDEMYDPEKSILVVMTSSMFMSTIDYWLDEDYYIMFDEPDDKSNSANSPTALLALHKIELKNKKYKWPQYRKVSNADDAKDFFKDFKDIYVGNGGSYDETPKHSVGSYLHHIKMMKKRMTNFKGKIFLASATIPEWLNKRVNQMSQKPATIEMEKPKNPRCAMFLPDYDDILKICLEEGNMGSLYEPLVGQVLNLATWINCTSEDIKNSIPVNDRQTQMRSRYTIAIGLPGLYEVNQIKRMESSGLVQFQEAHQTIKIDDIREFWKGLVLKWLSQERVQIAVQVSANEMDVLYIGSDGCQVIVPQTLMISPESDLIIIIKSIVKPNMLGKNLSIGILTMPITVLGKGAHSILEHLHQEGITVSEVCQIRDWLQDDRQVPFQLKDNTIRFDSNPNGSIKELSELGITILKCLRHLHKCQQELKYDDEAEASSCSSLFEKIMGVSNTGEASVYGELESENNLILDNYGLISHNHHNAFRCYYVLKHPISGKSYACTRTSDTDDTFTFYQKMSCTPRYESVEQLQHRQSSTDDIESRPVCGICGEVESTLLAVPVILSNPKDTTQKILTAFHQHCLRGHFKKQCPLTGNIISYYGQSSDNVFEIELSPEAEIPVDMKKQDLFLQKMIDAESETDDIKNEIRDINHYTGINYTFETLKEMDKKQLKSIWTTYYIEFNMICNSARRRTIELEEKKSRFKMEKELKLLQENAKMKASPLKYRVDFKLPQQQPKEQEKESCEKQQQPRQPRQKRRPRRPLASSRQVHSKQASPVSDEKPKQDEVKQVEVKMVKSSQPQFSPESKSSGEKKRRPCRFIPKRQ